MKLIYEKSQPGPPRVGASRVTSLPAPGAGGAARAEPPRLPELAESELVRHFTELSTRNFGIDTGFYPLGSCTMKYNPRVNERARRAARASATCIRCRRRRAPRARSSSSGACRRSSREVDRPRRRLAPAGRRLAGRAHRPDARCAPTSPTAASGEQRRKVVIPDTAHGTNPACVTMAGYELTQVKTDARGNIDVDDLRAKVDENTAGLMLTNPSTLGLFDENIEEIAEIFHGAGRAHVLRRREPERRLRHLAARRHGLRHRPHQPAQDVLAAARRRRAGRRPDRGARHARAVPAGPAVVARRGDAFGLDHDRPKSIGKVRGFTGPFGVFVRSYAFHRAYGPGHARDVRDRRAERELPARAAAGTPTTCRTTASACTSSSSRRGTLKREHGVDGARRGEAADGLRLPPADRSTSR